MKKKTKKIPGVTNEGLTGQTMKMVLILSNLVFGGKLIKLTEVGLSGNAPDAFIILLCLRPYDITCIGNKFQLPLLRIHFSTRSELQ